MLNPIDMPPSAPALASAYASRACCHLGNQLRFDSQAVFVLHRAHGHADWVVLVVLPQDGQHASAGLPRGERALKSAGGDHVFVAVDHVEHRGVTLDGALFADHLEF
jgi:hypothetical protein